MKLGFIVGKNNEIYNNPSLKKITPKKYLQDTHNKKNQLHIDVAIAMTIKTKFPGCTVDIISPTEISLQRLKKNDINFVLGYDYISTIEEDPWVRKFQGPKGQQKLLDIYKDPNSNIFPPFKHLDFIWDKKKYLTKFQRSKIPINPTIFVKGSVNIPKLLAQLSSYKWIQFIVKPIGGCEGHGCGFFTTKDIISEPTKLMDYFIEHAEYYDEFLVQRLTDGFKKYGEVKSFWIGGEYSYSILTKDVPYSDSIVSPMTNEKILNKVKEIGTKVHKSIPKLEFNGKKTDPVMTRVDVVCCLDNKSQNSLDYYLNEIEEGGLAGTYTDFKQITFPIVEILADAYVRKANELLN
mgnify:CR=1 FL=1|tara:strand:+ start:75 stop:1124 length:1050 start_codon:yes stop_codon:yes gene_type:complete